ncbi:K(+)-transporting ATPase subunit F [Pandoraea bronchicola]
MTFIDLLSSAASMALFAYLFFALINPERF